MTRNGVRSSPTGRRCRRWWVPIYEVMTRKHLTIVTLAPEPTAHTSLGVSYLYGDLRALPLRDDWFD